MFKPVSNKVAFPQMEESILKVWEERETFKKSLEKNAGGERYKFYDGPPFATGLPHYGHLLAGTIKDIVPRYQTMRGKYVERRFGWDTHGLPIEALAQDALGVSGAHEIKALGVDKFNEQCRSMVLKYVSEWRKTVTRMGRWVDFDNDYKTMDFGFMESVWWVFKQLWNQGRVYRSHRIMPYSWKLSTPLSNFEAGSNYKDVQDPTVTVRAKALSGASDELKSLLAKEPTVYLLIWTTTPWTLPENLAICAGANIDYVAVRDVTDDARPVYVMAKARLPHIFKKEEQYEVVAEFKGTALKGVEYEPIFPYFADKRAEGAFRVLNDDYVTTDDGVGLVHIAPAYGEDDFRVCREAGMNAFVDPLDESCAFTAAVPEFKGRFCKDCASARTATRTSSRCSRRAESSCTRRRSSTRIRSATAPTLRSSTARSTRGTCALRISTSASRRTTRPCTGRPTTSERSASATGSRRRATGTSPATASGAAASRCG